jgi:hypothetical protein
MERYLQIPNPKRRQNHEEFADECWFDGDKAYALLMACSKVNSFHLDNNKFLQGYAGTSRRICSTRRLFHALMAVVGQWDASKCRASDRGAQRGHSVTDARRAIAVTVAGDLCRGCVGAISRCETLTNRALQYDVNVSRQVLSRFREPGPLLDPCRRIRSPPTITACSL